MRALRFPLGLGGLLALMLLASPAAAAPGDVLATGWGELDSSDWLKGSGRGVYVHGVSRTVYRWRSLRSATDRIVPFSPLWQAFTFTVRDDRNRHRVSFETSVRGGADLYRGGFRGDVLYAFVELSPEGRWGHVRVGRQLLASGGASGLTRFDGLSARLVLHHLAIETHAGASLRSRSFVVPEEEREGHETGWGKDWTYGVALSTSGLKHTQVRLGLHDRIRDGSIARRHLTLDVHQGILGRVDVRANLSIDLLQRRLRDVLAAVEGRPVGWLRTGIEYEHWQPSFDADHLFSVFQTDPYDSLRGYADARLGGVVDVWLSGGFQAYPLAVSNDNVPQADMGRFSASQRAGVRVRPLPFLNFQVDQRLLDGTGGTKFGLSLSGRATPLDGRLEVGLRGDFQVYDFVLQPGLAGHYGGLSVHAVARPVPWVRVGVRGETIFSPWVENDVQITATLDLLLGIKHLGRRGGSARLQDWQPAMLATSAAASSGASDAGGLPTQGMGIGGLR